MFLSNRLQQVAKFVDKDIILADIGSDHAYLPIYLIQNALIKKAYAMEIAVGPLNQSIKSIEEMGLKDQIIPVISNGLENISSDVEEITIAGMGGLTIIEILNNDFSKLSKYKKIIIQANSHMYDVRCFINKHHFRILEEDLVKDANKYYEILTFNTSKNDILTALELKYGPKLIVKKSEIFKEYYNNLLLNYKSILDNLSPNHSKYQEIYDTINEIMDILKVSVK